MARKPSAVARELLRNLPKGSGKKRRRRSKRNRDGEAQDAKGKVADAPPRSTARTTSMHRREGRDARHRRGVGRRSRRRSSSTTTRRRRRGGPRGLLPPGLGLRSRQARGRAEAEAGLRRQERLEPPPAAASHLVDPYRPAFDSGSAWLASRILEESQALPPLDDQELDLAGAERGQLAAGAANEQVAALVDAGAGAGAAADVGAALPAQLTAVQGVTAGERVADELAVGLDPDRRAPRRAPRASRRDRCRGRARWPASGCRRETVRERSRG